MTNELCARPGCGAPEAWHTKKSTAEELGKTWGDKTWGAIAWGRPEGRCIDLECVCPAYLTPPPPEPEKTAYVIEMTEATEVYWNAEYRQAALPAGSLVASVAQAVSLADYLASHPQPALPSGIKCMVADCPNRTGEGRFNGDLCYPCFERALKFSRDELSAGPQPAPRMCVCGHARDGHDDTAGCRGQFFWVSNSGIVRDGACACWLYKEASA